MRVPPPSLPPARQPAAAVHARATHRYTSKEYVDNVHWQSQPFKDFQAAVAALKLEWVSPLSATTYTERGIGF
jgi:hypothetical protein